MRNAQAITRACVLPRLDSIPEPLHYACINCITTGTTSIYSMESKIIDLFVNNYYVRIFIHVVSIIMFTYTQARARGHTC